MMCAVVGVALVVRWVRRGGGGFGEWMGVGGGFMALERGGRCRTGRVLGPWEGCRGAG